MLVPYTKTWLSISGQVQKLKDSGLVIRDDTAAELFLQHINYFRFNGYALAFELSRHAFLPGTTFCAAARPRRTSSTAGGSELSR